MKIFGLGMPELIIILIVILVIFGPKNLPKLGSAIGRSVKNLRDGMGGKKKEEESKQLDEADADVEDATEAPASKKAAPAKTQAKKTTSHTSSTTHKKATAKKTASKSASTTKKSKQNAHKDE